MFSDHSVAAGNDAPVIDGPDTVSFTVAENDPSNIGSAFSATDADGDAITWSKGGSAGIKFNINSAGQLSVKSDTGLNYEVDGASLQFTVIASDGNGGSDSVAVSVTVTDVAAEPPVIDGPASVRFTVAENTPGNFGSAFTATDPDGDTITWSVGGAAGDWFNISSDGQLSVASATGLDYEEVVILQFTVIASDGTNTDSVAVTVTVTDGDDPPVIDGPDSVSFTVAENTPGNIGSAFTATDDGGGAITWSVGAAAGDWFEISSAGQLSVKSATGLDYGDGSILQFTVIASDDNDLTDKVAVTVRVTDVAEPPVIGGDASVTIEVAENTTGNIGSAFTATDDDIGDSITWSVGGADAGSFAISASGQLSVTTGLNYEAGATRSITVIASDGTSEDSVAVTVTVTDDRNEPPDKIEGVEVRYAAADSVTIHWPKPTNPGPVIINYNVRYRVAGATTGWTVHNVSASAPSRSKTVTGLASNTKYEAQVRSSSQKGNSKQSDLAYGKTTVPTGSNNIPVIHTHTIGAYTIGDGETGDLGDPIVATDLDAGDSISWSVSGSDASSFSITGGQLAVTTGLAYTDGATRSFTVTVSDGTDTDSETVTVNVNSCVPAN